MRELNPAPIAVALATHEAEQHAFLKLHRLVDAYEALLKYVTVLTIQNFYSADLGGSFPEVDRLVRERLVRPHLGDWAGFLRQVLQCFAEHKEKLFSTGLFTFHFRSFGANPRLRSHLGDQGASGRLLTLRNARAHGATLPDQEAVAQLREHEHDLSTLLAEADFLVHLPLYQVGAETEPGVFQVLPLMGADYRQAPPTTLRAASLPVGHAVVQNPQTGVFLHLHPLLVYAECQEEVPVWDAEHKSVTGKEICGKRKTESPSWTTGGATTAATGRLTGCRRSSAAAGR